MRSRRAVGLWAAALLVILAGCRSAPEVPPAPMADASFTIVEHRYSALGGDIPDWTTMDTGELEEDERFEGALVFRFEETGKDLAGVQNVVDNMNAPAEVARLISTQVEQIFAGAQVGDQDFVETYFQNVVKTIARAEINGLRKYGYFWVKKQYTEPDGSEGEQEYVYYTLYTIGRDQVEELIDRAVAQLEADTEEERTARELVRDILADEL